MAMTLEHATHTKASASPVSQPAKQPTNEPASQPANQPSIHPVSQLVRVSPKPHQQQ